MVRSAAVEDATDLLGAVLSPLAPTTPAQPGACPGGTLSRFERHKNVQLQLGAVGEVAGDAGRDEEQRSSTRACPFPDPSVTRFGRVDVFGQGR